MANRSSIVRYAFFGGVGAGVIAIFGTGLGRREGFGDMGFEAISAQDIRFFGVAGGFAGNIGSVEVGKVMEGVEGGVRGGVSGGARGKVTGGFEGEIGSSGNAGWLGIGKTVSFGVGVSEGVDLGFFWW